VGKPFDGGPAFPNVASDERVGVYVGDAGMSLRDYFAAAVLPSVHQTAARAQFVDAELIATECYEIADAMIEARAKAVKS
jgi:hypothetical protein